MIGRPHHVVLDCPDPGALADFYAELLGMPVTHRASDFAVVSVDTTTSGFAFQRVRDHVRPGWPDPARPQQVHLDVMVEDPAEAGRAAVAIGASVLDASTHVYADPAGHPFCLVPRPGWAPPVGPARVARVEG